MDNDDLALRKSPRLQNAHCIQTPRQTMVRKAFLDALEGYGLRHLVYARKGNISLQPVGGRGGEREKEKKMELPPPILSWQ